MWSPSLSFFVIVSYVKRSMECQTISCCILSWLKSTFLTNPNDESFSVHKCNWKSLFFFMFLEINCPVSNTKNNVYSGIFNFLMDIIHSGSKASFFKQDAFINWQWKSAWLDIIIQSTCIWHRVDTQLTLFDTHLSLSLSYTFFSKHCQCLIE